MRETLSQQEILSFTRRPGLQSLFWIGKEWATIALVWLVAAKLDHPLAYLLGILCVGRCQYALGVLGHEASHGLLFSNRFLNEFIGNWFCSLPHHYTLSKFRAVHLKHHAKMGEADDPDRWRLCRNLPNRPVLTRRMYFPLVLSGLIYFTPTFWESLRQLGAIPSKREKHGGLFRWLGLVLFEGLTVLALTHFHLWKLYLLLWLWPLFTVALFIKQIGALTEHEGTPATDPLNSSRTTLLKGWERFLTAYNLNYHLEHHLYPTVPWFRLPRLHQRLEKDADFRRLATVSHGYFTPGGAISEVLFAGTAAKGSQISPTSAH